MVGRVICAPYYLISIRNSENLSIYRASKEAISNKHGKSSNNRFYDSHIANLKKQVTGFDAFD